MSYGEPGLLAGWEHEAPDDDTLLRQFLSNWATSSESPVTAMGGRCLRRGDLVATSLGRPAGFLNNVTLLMPLDPSTLPETMSSIDDFFGSDRIDEILLFSPWPTPDLRAFGWRLEGHPPLMLRPPGGRHPQRHDLDIEEISETEGLREFHEVVVPGYPIDGMGDGARGLLLQEPVLAESRLRCWVGRRNGRPVSAVSVFVDSGINDVTLLATLPEERGKGYGEALMWRATLSSPQLPAMLLSSDLGRRVYQRMGYLPLMRFTVWQRR